MSWGIILVFISTFLTAAGQMLWKSGSAEITLSIISFFTNPKILAGIGLYVIATVLVISALRQEEFSIAFPVISASYIWILVGSVYILGETINTINIIGVVCILLGITALGIGSKKKNQEKEKQKTLKEVLS